MTPAGSRGYETLACTEGVETQAKMGHRYVVEVMTHKHVCHNLHYI